MDISVVTMYAITPCHAGSGSSLGVVDLPIQRERASNWPVIQASGVKGAFRANFDKYKNQISEKKEQVKDFNKLTESIFGTSEGSGYAGSLSVSDAKILAYPMRSNISPFIWITCPSVLKRLARDLEFAGKITDAQNVKIPEIKGTETQIIFNVSEGKVLLEDYEVDVKGSFSIGELKPYLERAERLILVSDDVFNYGVSDCTQIMAQIQIDSKTGTTKEGSLRYQEELPSDTIMYSVICWGDTKNSLEENLKAGTIKNFVKDQVITTYIQIAGDESCGRGIFKLDWNEKK